METSISQSYLEDNPISHLLGERKNQAAGLSDIVITHWLGKSTSECQAPLCKREWVLLGVRWHTGALTAATEQGELLPAVLAVVRPQVRGEPPSGCDSTRTAAWTLPVLSAFSRAPPCAHGK
jgi:hypothetical protein